MTTFTVVILTLATIVAIVTVVAVTKNLQKSRELRHSYDKISQKLALLKDFEGDLTALQNKIDFSALILLHKDMFYRHCLPAKCGADEYGMYRVKSIADLDRTNIYLGGINGLFTHTISEWQSICEEGSVELHEVYNQYWWQLLSNVRADIHRLEIAKSNLVHRLGK
jgi:hypothetical protein